MKLILSSLLIFFLTGCAISKVPYNSETDVTKKDKQFFEHNECTYLVGPINIDKTLKIDDLVTNTILYANANGLHGDKLINIKIKEGGYTTIFFSKLCLYISGNVVYSDRFDY